MRGQLTRPNIKLQPEQIAALVAAYKRGGSVAKLAKQFGLHEQTAASHLRRQGVTIRQQWLEGAVADSVIDRYRAGASIRALAEQHQVSYETVRWLLNDRCARTPGKRRGRYAASS